MNCYRQADIRMQCKTYDSLLYLPPELQAGRGLMCCSVALSGLGLLVALIAIKCTSWFQGIKWAKTAWLMVAGGIQFMACICVFIPVSWTAHVIITNVYNSLRTDTQRRELGEALYIGWVTGAFLFASASLFTCGCFNSGDKPEKTSYHPVSTVGSTRSSRIKTLDTQPPISLENVAPEIMNGEAQVNRSTSANQAGSIHIPGNSLYVTQNTTPFNGLCDPVAYNSYY